MYHLPKFKMLKSSRPHAWTLNLIETGLASF